LRFCPCGCGYEDPVCWHSYRWITDIDIARIEDFTKEYPQWADIELGCIIEDKYCYYRRSGKRNGGTFILRWPKILGRNYYKSRFFERFKAKRTHGPLPGQKQLELEVSH
jgi:hypothetical protein